MKLRYAVSALALASGIAMPAFAQDGSAGQGGLAEIIVTATKRSENLQNVPVAVSAISSDMLQSKGVFETSDLNASMPNLQVSSPYGQQQPNWRPRRTVGFCRDRVATATGGMMGPGDRPISC